MLRQAAVVEIAPVTEADLGHFDEPVLRRETSFAAPVLCEAVQTANFIACADSPRAMACMRSRTNREK